MELWESKGVPIMPEEIAELFDKFIEKTAEAIALAQQIDELSLLKKQVDWQLEQIDTDLHQIDWQSGTVYNGHVFIRDRASGKVQVLPVVQFKEDVNDAADNV